MEDLDAALRAHNESIFEFIAAARSFDLKSWWRPLGLGKWSPAQVAEHLALSYEAAWGMLNGHSSGENAPRFLRSLFRTILLDPVLASGSRAQWIDAPPVCFPCGIPAHPVVVTERLKEAAQAFEMDAAGINDRDVIRHPFFGPMTVIEAVMQQEIHTNFHRRRLLRRMPEGAALAAFDRYEKRAFSACLRA